MSVTEPISRKFQPGSSGWTADDLDSPKYQWLSEKRRLEIIGGVLTKIPAAFFDGTEPLNYLSFLLQSWHKAHGHRAYIAHEAHLVLDDLNVPCVDMLLLTAAQREEQLKLQAGRKGRRKVRFGMIRVRPTLIVESISLGHEKHDQKHKFSLYASAGIPNYWILDAYRQSLDCYALNGSTYTVDQAGKQADEIRPSLFPGLIIPLNQLWD